MEQRTPLGGGFLSPTHRAKSTNSIYAFDGDGRTTAARVCRDTVHGLLLDLGCTESELSRSAWMQVRAAAYTRTDIETARRQMARGAAFDLTLLNKLECRFSRQLWALGLALRQRNTLGQGLPLKGRSLSEVLRERK